MIQGRLLSPQAFRVLFFTSLALHVVPLVADWHDMLLADGAFKAPDPAMAWVTPWIWRFPIVLWLTPYALFLGIALGCLGLYLRFAAALTVAGLLVAYACNEMGTRAASIPAAIVVLTIVAVFGFGGRRRPIDRTAARDNLPTWLIAGYTLTALWRAGFEKWRLGWWENNAMYALLNTPPGIATRPWLAACEFCRAEAFGQTLTGIALGLELFMPLLFLHRRTRFAGWLGILALFVGIEVMLAVPPTFPAIFVLGPALIVDAPHWAWKWSPAAIAKKKADNSAKNSRNPAASS